MFRQFEDINFWSLNAGLFRKGAAMTIPGIGIVVGKAGIDNRDLLRHEFGCMLRFRQWGFLFYWLQMAPVSLSNSKKIQS